MQNSHQIKSAGLILLSVSVFIFSFSTESTAQKENSNKPLVKTSEFTIREDRIPQEKEQKIAKLITTLRIWKLTNLLNLSEEENIRFFTKLQKMENQKRVFHELRLDSIKRLKELLKQKPVKQKKITEILQQMEAAQRGFQQTQNNFLASLKEELSQEQLAKYLIFESEFQTEIRQTLEKIKELQLKDE